MLKIVVLACALLGILTAVSVESWLRRHTGNKELASAVYLATLEKYSEFWFTLLIPTAVILAIIGIFVGAGLGTMTLAGYAAGAITSLIGLFAGSRSHVSGTVSAASLAADGDLKSSMRSAYRSGSVMGLAVSAACLSTLSILFFFVSQEQINSVIGGFGFGFCLVTIGLRLSGSILTSAHKLSSLDEQAVDYMGAFTANGADYAESYILAVCSTTLLAGVGVATAGGGATFSVDSAAKFPIVILACGLACSVIGIMIYRAGTGKYAHFGFTAGNIVSGALLFAASVYFSDYSLKDRSYSFCIGFGILAQLISGEYSKAFSMDGSIFRRNLPNTKDEIVDVPMLHGLSVGLISAAVPALLTAIAVFLSFNVAQYYGVALCAVGAVSVTAVNLAVRDYASALASSCSFARAADESYEENEGYYRIFKHRASLSKAAGRGYSAVASALTFISLLIALTITSEKESVDLADPLVFGGMIVGTITVLLLLGLLIRSIITSTALMADSPVEDPDEYRNIASVRGVLMLEILAVGTPALVGLVMGSDCLIGFIGAAGIAGMTLVFAFNNTGRYYDRIASDALGTIIKTMAIVSIICIPAFSLFGGFSF